LWNVFTSRGTDVGGARQYFFEFNLSLWIRTTLLYICMYMYVYACIFMYMYVFVCLCMYVYACACMSMYDVRVCMYVYVYACACMSMYMYVCMCMYVYVCLCTCMYMHVYVCICIYISVYVWHMKHWYITRKVQWCQRMVRVFSLKIDKYMRSYYCR